MEALGALIKGGHDLDDLLDRYSWDRLGLMAQCLQYAEHAWGEGLFGKPKKGGDRFEQRRQALRNTAAQGTSDGAATHALGVLSRMLPGSVAFAVGDEAKRAELDATARAFWGRADPAGEKSEEGEE